MEDAFIRNIVEEPDDLLARRAYGDWLMEQPDSAVQERGEFIALQLDLAGRPPSTTRRQLMRQREAELLDRHGEKWAGGIRHLVRKYTFRRGMIESIVLDCVSFVLGGDELFPRAPITEVGLADLDSSYLASVVRCPHLARLRALDLSRAGLAPHQLQALLGSPYLNRLDRLDLTSNPIGDEGALHLASAPVFPQLTHLSLARTGLTVRGVRGLLQAALRTEGSGLVALNVRGNPPFGFAGAVSLLAELGPTLSAAQQWRARRLLAPLIDQATRRQSRGLAGVIADPLMRFAPEGLMHPDQQVRRLTVAALAGGSVGAYGWLAPLLLQRAFESLSNDGKQALQLVAANVSHDLRKWLGVLGATPANAEIALMQALCQGEAELPPLVHTEFAALCQRRLNWRASHGRAGRAPPAPANAGTDRMALWDLASLVLRHAEDAGLRHSREELPPAKRAVLGRHARHREAACLCRWLMELLLRHKEGTLPGAR